MHRSEVNGDRTNFGTRIFCSVIFKKNKARSEHIFVSGRLFCCVRIEGGRMEIEMLQGKIHRATVTQAELDYVGSITVDTKLMEAAGICEYQKVQIADIDNGERFETYTIAGEAGSGKICLNGAAARCVSVGDKIIIMAYCACDSEEARRHKPKVVFVDDENRPVRVTSYEKHGRLEDM